MFSFVSKPGKHLLIETDEEDGQLENGPVPNKNNKNVEFRSAKFNNYAGEFLFYRTCCVYFFQVMRRQ